MIDGDPNGSLPDGWKTTTLGEIGTYLNGRAFKSSEWSRTGRPIIRIQDLTGSNRHPNYYEGEVDERHTVRPGDFLISWSATLGAYIWDGPEAVLNQHIFKVLTRIDQRFHYYLVQNLIAELERHAHGSGMVHVTKGVFDNTAVALPPEPEQRMIAARLDEIASRLESSTAHLQAAGSTVDRFRRAVLSAAGSGRLTRDLRGAEAEEDGIPATWTQETVASLAAQLPRAIQSGPFGSNLKHSEFQPSGKLVIGIDNVLDGTFSLGKQHRISDNKFAELSKYEARPLDVLITVMATVGRVCVVPADIEPAIITKHVYRITVDRDRVVPDFLALALRGHPKVREQIHHESRGQTRPGINGQIVKGLVISLPPIHEQHEILKRTQALMASADELSSRIDRGAEAVRRTWKAALAVAFRGELLATGPFVGIDVRPAAEAVSQL